MVISGKCLITWESRACSDPGEINNCMSVLDSVYKDVHHVIYKQTTRKNKP